MWFRFYVDALNDPKVQRLPAERFKQWVNLLCLAKEGDGLLPSIEDIAFRLRIPDTEAQSLVEELAAKGLLDADGENFSPHNWHGRQFVSDNSTERVKRFRNNNGTFTETVPEADTDSETEPEQSRAETEASSASRGKPRSARAPVLPDDEWLDAMQKNPAYSMLNVRMLYLRMLEWCKERNKVPSRRRLINWMNNEDKPMTAKSSPPKAGNGYVGASKTPMSIVGKAAEDGAAYMAKCVEDLIAEEDFLLGGQIYDEIIQRGGAKLDWEIRLVAWYELHKDEPATPEQVAQINASIQLLAKR